MKKYLKMLPVILYPYAYLIYFLVYFFVSDALPESVRSQVIVALTVACHVVAFADAIYGAVNVARNKCTAHEAARMNLTIKAWQIPAYIFHFILGFLGLMMSVWGIGFIMFAIYIDVVTIALTGINAIGCMVKMRKKGALSTVKAVLAVVGSFIFCVDVVIAIVLCFISRKTQENEI